MRKRRPCGLLLSVGHTRRVGEYTRRLMKAHRDCKGERAGQARSILPVRAAPLRDSRAFIALLLMVCSRSANAAQCACAYKLAFRTLPASWETWTLAFTPPLCEQGGATPGHQDWTPGGTNHIVDGHRHRRVQGEPPS
jgi:hypothetical protein